MTLSPKLKLVLSACSICCLGATAIVAWHATGTTRSASAGGMRAAYDAKVAALATPSRIGRPLPVREAAFRAALRKEDFVEASNLAMGVGADDRAGPWSSSPFTDFMTGVVEDISPDMQQHLDAWVRHDDKNALPLAMRAQYEYSIGWHVRGHGFNAAVTSADRDLFASYMCKALADIDKALSLRQDRPISLLYLKLRIQQSAGSPHDRQVTFAQAIAVAPNYYPIYQLMLSTLQPKWGGSIDGMYQFVETHVAATDRYSPLRLLYLELYKDLVDAASVECRASAGTDGGKAACMRSTLDRFGAGQLDANVREALLLYNHADRYQFGVAIRQPILSILQTRDVGAYGSAVLQMAADAMRSDVRLVEAEPGRNDYIIDGLVASSWYQVGNYANALEKDEEALADLPRTTFPDGDAKDAARAEIYVQTSAALGKLHDYTGQAAYERASDILGGRNGYEHAICFAFFEAGARDEVIPACDEAVAANTDDMETYYWRAQALIDRKRGGEAVADLQRVAGSEDDLRALSAIDLSMIWFGRNDIRAALDVLDTYTYLYDATRTARDDVAIAYNNRCYARMQLGDLHKALADCKMSLQYGQIPDAYAKKAELEKRIAALPI